LTIVIVFAGRLDKRLRFEQNERDSFSESGSGNDGAAAFISARIH